MQNNRPVLFHQMDEPNVIILTQNASDRLKDKIPDGH